MTSKYRIHSSRVIVLSLGLFAALPSATGSAEPVAKPSASAPVAAPSGAPSGSTTVSDDATGWEKVGVSEGITSYKKEIPGDPVVALRGEGVIDASLVRVASVILDDSRAKEWVDSLEESKRIRTYGEREALEYNHIGTPFVLKDRDFLTRVIVEGNPQEKWLTLKMTSVEDPAMPPTRYVRGTLQGYWKMKSFDNDSKTYVITEMHADPKGSVPKWIVNLFQKGWAKRTLESLRKQVSKKDIQVIPEVAKIFGLPGGLK